MKNDILIAYYSWHGNTKKIATLMQRATGGTLFAIEPVESYTTDYNAAVAQAKKEIQAGFRPELKVIPQTASYAVVFLGTPIWWHTMAPPLATLIDSVDLKGKTVAPFYTHGGGGPGTYERDVARMCQGSTIVQSFGTYEEGGHDAETQVSVWLRAIGVHP